MDGTLIRKSFYSAISQSDAQRQADEYRIEKEASSLAGINFVDRTCPFDQFARQWLEVYKKPIVDVNTYQWTYLNMIEKHLIPFFKDYPINQIQPVDIQQFYSQNTAKSESFTSKARMCLQSIFDAAVENHICGSNPAKSKTLKLSFVPPTEKQIYSDEELNVAEEYFMRTFPDIVLLINTGLRRGELLGCHRDEINISKKSLTINRSIADVRGKDRIKVNPPKWKSYRAIPLNDAAMDALDRMPFCGNILLPTRTGQYQSPNTWSRKYMRHMKRFYEETGIKILNPHELRHTFGTTLRRKGVDIYTIQKIMGHKDIRMTSEIYVKNEFEVLQTEIEAAYQSNMHKLISK